MNSDLSENFKENFVELGKLRQSGKNADFLNLLKETCQQGVKHRDELTLDMRTHFIHTALDLFHICRTRDNATLLSRLLEKGKEVLYFQHLNNNISIHLSNPNRNRIPLTLDEQDTLDTNSNRILSDVFENEIVFVTIKDDDMQLFSTYEKAKWYANDHKILNMVIEN